PDEPYPAESRPDSRDASVEAGRRHDPAEQTLMAAMSEGDALEPRTFLRGGHAGKALFRGGRLLGERLQIRPDVGGNLASAGGVRMHAIALHHVGVANHVRQQEWHKLEVVAISELPI